MSAAAARAARRAARASRPLCAAARRATLAAPAPRPARLLSPPRRSTRRDLQGNQLGGTVPDGICKLCDSGQLLYCYLQNNPFACPLPSCAVNVCGATCK